MLSASAFDADTLQIPIRDLIYRTTTKLIRWFEIPEYRTESNVGDMVNNVMEAMTVGHSRLACPTPDPEGQGKVYGGFETAQPRLPSLPLLNSNVPTKRCATSKFRVAVITTSAPIATSPYNIRAISRNHSPNQLFARYKRYSMIY